MSHPILVDAILLSNILYMLQYASEKLEQAGALYTAIESSPNSGTSKKLCQLGKEMVYDVSDTLLKQKDSFETATYKVTAGQTA